VLNPGREDERDLTSKIAGLRLKKNDVVSWQLAGGGGYGSPLARSPERVLRDVRMGYVTREGARADYGVVVREDLTLDEEATTALRSGRAA
jgi:N-methylhydantoinase B/oxoprolinase/acetone carboxylase alpha subunit